MAQPLPLVVALGEVLWDEFSEGVRLGGAPANFAVHCAALGARVLLVSRVGEDARGRETLEILRGRGVNVAFVQRDPERPTGRVVVTLDEGRPSYEIVEGVAWDAVAWEDGMAGIAREADVVCFGTLGQRSARSRETLMRFVREARGLRALDINFRQHYHSEEVVLASLALADLLKLSDEETPTLRGYLGGPVEDGAFLQEVRSRFGIERVVLTMGAKGCRILGPEGDVRVPGVPRQVVNTVGAGDAFAAAFVLSRLAGRNDLASGREANRVGGFVTTQDSGTPELPEEFRISG